MRLSIFSKVLLPAPFRPMIPITSPFLTSKETSLRAQNVSVCAFLKGCLNRSTITSRKLGLFSELWVSSYDFASPRMDIATSDDIRKPPFHTLERKRTKQKHEQHYKRRV